MRTDTVYNMLQETRRTDANTWRDSFQRKVLGITVLTAYNNKTYRIDDVDFEKSPMTTFSRRDGEISIDKYYTEVRRPIFQTITTNNPKFVGNDELHLNFVALQH